MSNWIPGSVALFATAMLVSGASTGLAQDALSLNESKTMTVYAKAAVNASGIKLVAGKKYRFTVGSPEWNNGSRETTAAGYSDSSPSRRWPDYKMMELVGEIFNDDGTSTGKHFRIGMGREYTAAATGELVTAANECQVTIVFLKSVMMPHCYVDNSRVVTLTVKRIE